MKTNEFKAWFDGFTEAIDGSPSAKQWKRICARVAEIDDVPMSQQIFIDRWRPYVPYWPRPYEPSWTAGPSFSGDNLRYVTTTALQDAGRAEFRSLNAT